MWLKSRSKTSLGQLGELESVLMEWMWQHGEASVADAQAQCAPNLAYTTIMTTMVRLWKKGLLKRWKNSDSKAYIYHPALNQHEYQEQITRHILRMVLSEDLSAGAVLSHFVDAVCVDEEMLKRLEQLVKAKQRALRQK